MERDERGDCLLLLVLTTNTTYHKLIVIMLSRFVKDSKVSCPSLPP